MRALAPVCAAAMLVVLAGPGFAAQAPAGKAGVRAKPKVADAPAPAAIPPVEAAAIPPPPPAQAAPPAEVPPAGTGERVVEAYSPEERQADAGSIAAEQASGQTAPRWSLEPMAGLGFTSEALTDSAATPTFLLGVEAAYSFSRQARAQVGVRDRFFRRTYVTDRPDLGGQGAAVAQLDEQEIAADALFSWELTRTLGIEDPRPRLAGVIGPSVRFFHNDALRSQAGGVGLGAQASFAIGELVDASAAGLYTYNLFFGNDALASALGGPTAVGAWTGSLGLRLARGTRIGLGYEGEAVVLEKSYRLFHTLTFGFGLSL